MSMYMHIHLCIKYISMRIDVSYHIHTFHIESNFEKESRIFLLIGCINSVFPIDLHNARLGATCLRMYMSTYTYTYIYTCRHAYIRIHLSPSILRNRAQLHGLIDHPPCNFWKVRSG